MNWWLFKVSACVHFVLPMRLISAGYGFLHFLVFFSCISKHKIHVMLKLFPNMFKASEQICIFKIRVKAKLTVKKKKRYE